MIKLVFGKFNEKTRLLLLVSIALGLRLFHIGFRSIWLDEAYSLKLASASIGNIIKGAAMDIHPPLFHIILSIWIASFGNSEIALRALSALCGSMLVLVMYKFVSAWSSKQAGWMTALLVAVSPYFIELSRSGRMASMLSLFMALALWMFWKFINEKEIRYGFGFSLSMLAAMYTHYFSFLLLIAFYLYIFLGIGKLKLSREKRKAWFLFQGLLLVGYAPWLTSMWNHLSKGGPSWRGNGAFLLEPLHSIYAVLVGTACWSKTDKFLTIALIGAAISLIIYLMRKQIGRIYTMTSPRGWGLMATIFFSVLVMVWLYSKQKINVFDNRYLSMVALTLISVLGGIIALLSNKQKVIVFILLISGFSIPLFNQYFVYGYYDNWREVARTIESNISKNNESVVIYPAWNETPLRYYLNDVVTIQGLPGHYDPISGVTENYFYIDQEHIDQIQSRVDLKKPVFLIMVNQGEAQTMIREWFLTYYTEQAAEEKGSITLLTLYPKEL